MLQKCKAFTYLLNAYMCGSPQEGLTSCSMTHVAATSPDRLGDRLMAGVMLFKLLSNDGTIKNCSIQSATVFLMHDLQRHDNF